MRKLNLFRFLSFFSVLFAFVFAENNSHVPSYKFGILEGEPDSYNGSTSVQVTSFDECVEKCEEDFECILASQKSDSEPCNLFKWNTVTGVNRNDSGGEGWVAFRVFTEQPSCELNLPLLLNGKKYPLYENNTKEYLWKVDTSEDGWSITYIRSLHDDGMICGNWSYLRPYSDGCNPECLLTMVQVYAEPGPLSPDLQNTTEPISDWNECMQWCYGHGLCLVAYWNDADGKCGWFGIDDGFYFLNKTTADSGKRMVIKLNLNNETCKYTTDQLLKDTYFVGDNTNKTVQLEFDPLCQGIDNAEIFLPYYRVRTTQEYYAFQFFGNEATKSKNGGYGCPLYFYIDLYGLETDQNVCSRPFQFSGLTQPKAKQLCEEMGGYLWIERFAGFLDNTQSQLLVNDSFPLNKSWKIWLGLELDPECIGEDESTSYCSGNQKWQMSDPSWPLYGKIDSTHTQTSIAFTWETGHPLPNKKCVYLQLKTPNNPSGHSLVSADCDEADIDGFMCSTNTQQRMRIPKYLDMLDKYGYNVTYDEKILQAIKQQDP